MKLRRGIYALVVLTILGLCLLPGPAGAIEPVNTYVGESTTLKLPYQFSKMALGDPTVADYMVQRNATDGAEILVNGKTPGLTNLIVWDMQGTQRDVIPVNVLVRDVKAYLAQIKAMIGHVEGLTFRLAGGKLFISGQVTTTRERDLINKVVAESPQVIKTFTINPVSLRVMADSIQQHLNRPTVRVRPVAQKIVIEGVVYNDAEKKRAEKLAKIYYDNIENLLEVRKAELKPGYGDTVQVTAHFMELNNATIDGWGFSWLPGSESAFNFENDVGGGSGFVGSITGVIRNLFPRLSSLKEVGGGRVLETSSMSVRSGEWATFHSGGEVALPVAQATGAVSYNYKEYGVFLKVLPIAEGQALTTKLEVEVSSPTDASPGGHLNFSKSKVSTVQYCKSGDSIAIGGLISNKHTKVFDKLPDGASDALVQLYASEEFRNDRSQFVVFVTPAVLKGGAKDAHMELKGAVEEKFNAYQENKR